MPMRSGGSQENFSPVNLDQVKLPKENETLIFLGTVKKISVSHEENSLKDWVVEFKIDHIQAGSFEGKTFSFRVHSPARSGLEKGKTYVVEAKWIHSGYSVDENQWMNPPGHSNDP